MTEQCGNIPGDGPACDWDPTCADHFPNDTDDVDEYNRDERIETIYQGRGAREMAERIVDLEDELGADVDGICTGMYADVAEAHCEIERLNSILGYYEFRTESEKDSAGVAEWTAVRSIQLMNEAGRQCDRYRLAWLSARRRAADEANFGMEALDLKTAEIARLRAELADLREAIHEDI